MARGGFERPPWWAVVVIVVGAIALVVGLLFGGRSTKDPVSAAEMARESAAASSAAASEAAAAPKRVLFLGDSYSAGTGATSQAKRWTTLVAVAQHWEQWNLAFGGTGYVTALSGTKAQKGCGQDSCPSYAQALRTATVDTPALVLVSGGRNDLPNIGPGYADSVAAFFKDLRARFPKAQIVATSPLWDDNLPPSSLVDVARAAQAGVRAVGGRYLNIGEPLEGHPNLVIADGIHPNDAGHEAIAEAVDRALAQTG